MMNMEIRILSLKGLLPPPTYVLNLEFSFQKWCAKLEVIYILIREKLPSWHSPFNNSSIY